MEFIKLDVGIFNFGIKSIVNEVEHIGMHELITNVLMFPRYHPSALRVCEIEYVKKCA